MKIVVGLSGGVDSSVAAAILKDQGHEVYGVTMKVWDEEGDPNLRAACIGPGEKDDIEMAQKIAASLDIPFKVIDLSQQYRDVVLDYFTSEYKEGKTPNPCIHCNRQIKFGALLEKSREAGFDFDYFATGHYARIEKNPETGRFILQRATHLRKDQSYFLSLLTQEQLSKVMFPLSGYTKEQVREYSRKLGLITSEKPESQDFYSGDYADLFDELPGEGPIVDTEGKRLGTHRGIIRYTIGQRRGLGIAYNKPLYVVAIDAAANSVVVGTEDKLYREQLVAEKVNWVSIPEITEPMEVQVKIRYRHAGAVATIKPLGEGKVQVSFYQPIKAITPGQIAVFYDGDTVLGGGTIVQEG